MSDLQPPRHIPTLPYTLLAVIYFAASVCTALIGFAAPDFVPVAVLCAFTGLFMGGGGCGLIALAALAYPTFMRSTGIGWGLGWSRLGSAIGPLLAGVMVSASWSPARVFLALGLIGVANALVVAVMGVVARSRRMAAAPA